MIKELFAKDVQSKYGDFIIPAAIGTGGLVMVKADWCGYCKRAMPELQKVSNMTGNAYPIYKIDADKNKSLVNSMGVNGYPTIMFIERDGKLSEKYEGERDSKSILDKICKKARKCY
jgi:thiol-disulfide isomerase/thioredoxin